MTLHSTFSIVVATIIELKTGCPRPTLEALPHETYPLTTLVYRRSLKSTSHRYVWVAHKKKAKKKINPDIRYAHNAFCRFASKK